MTGADMAGRIDRGTTAGGDPPFSQAQRIYLLERDFDMSEIEDEKWKAEVKTELRDIKRLVSVRLNTLVGIGFSLLIAVIAVLVTSQTQ
jgi:hypothetical protein